MRDETATLHQTDLMHSVGVVHSSAGASVVVPEFLSLTGHPVRWQLISELARSDRQVRELVALVGRDVVRVMRERGIDISGRHPTHVDEVAAQHFDHVISLCARVREVCPDFPGFPTVAHWSIHDPSAPT